MTAQNDEERGLKLTLAVYVAVFALKFVVYLMSGVMALLAESLHTLSDIFIAGFLLVAARYSRKRADEMHMFGHGRAQNIAALVAATLFISFTSFELYREAIPHLGGGETLVYQNLPLVIGVLILSMFIAAAPLVTLFRQKQRGAAAKAQLVELVNDELGLVAALFGTLLIGWGFPLADPLAAILVATVIAVNAAGLFRENVSFLLGRAPGGAFRAEAEKLARGVPGVLGVHDMRMEYVGPEAVYVSMHIVVSRGIPIEEANLIARRVREQIVQNLKTVYCIIHVDPAAPAPEPPSKPPVKAETPPPEPPAASLITEAVHGE